MKKLLTILCFTCVSYLSIAQPSGYVPGTFRNWNVGFGHYVGFFKAAGWDPTKDHVLFFFGGDGQLDTDTTTMDDASPAALLVGAGNWNGVTTMPDATTRKWMIFTLPNVGYVVSTYKYFIEYIYANCGVTIDTSTSGIGRIHYCGISGGPGRMYGWIVGDQGVSSPYQNKYTTTIAVSATIPSPSLASMTGKKNRVWFGTADTNPGTPPSFSYTIYNVKLPGVGGVDKFLDSTLGTGHSNATWGQKNDSVSCFGLTGHLVSSNRFIWMISAGEALGGSNQNPIANAGGDQSVNLPTTSTTLDGSGSFDPDGSIASYSWTKVSGPSGGTFSAPSSVSTQVNLLQQGTYVFQLTVTDNLGATGSDQMQVVVNPSGVSTFPIGKLFYRKVGGRDFLVFLADTGVVGRPHNIQRTVYNIIDSSGKDTTYAKGIGILKQITVNGWNGRYATCPGDTVSLNIVTQVNAPDKKDTMEVGIQYMLDSLPAQCFDSSRVTGRKKNMWTGIGQGAASEMTYLLDQFSTFGQGGTLKFRHSFGVGLWLDMRTTSAISNGGFNKIDTPFKSWGWSSSASAGFPYPVTTTRQVRDSLKQFNPAPLTKETEVNVNYSPITWDSAYSLKGQSGVDNPLLWFIDPLMCEDTTLQKIPISEPMVIGMAGDDGGGVQGNFGSGAKDEYYMFDSPDDPKRNIIVDNALTDGQIFAGRDIFCRRFNTHGTYVNMQKVKVIREVWVKYTRSSTRKDTVDIFSHGDRINTLSFISGDLRNRTDYLVRCITPGTPSGWQRVYFGFDTTQYLYVNSRSYAYTSPTEQVNDGVQEIVVYGYDLPGGVAETYLNLASEDSLNVWEKQRSKIGNLSGTNLTNLWNLNYLTGYTNYRNYGEYIFYTSKGRYPYNNLTIQVRDAHIDSASLGWYWTQIMNIHKAKFNNEIPFNYMAMQGTNRYVTDTQFVTKKSQNSMAGPYTWMTGASTDSVAGTDNHRCVDSVGQDPADYHSYKTASWFTYHWVAYYGSKTNVPVDTPRITMDDPAVSKLITGAGLNNQYEPGNENNNKFLTNYMMPVEAAVKQWALYNGFFNQMGPYMGSYYADSTLNLYLPAVSGWNYKYQLATILACKIIGGPANAGKLPFKVVAVHIYHIHKDYDPTGDSSMFVPGGHGIHPEGAHYLEWVDTITRAIRRYCGSNVIIDISEFGWDKTFVRPLCFSGCGHLNSFEQTLYGLPNTDNAILSDSGKLHAVLIVKTIANLSTSSVNRAAHFMHIDELTPTRVGTVPYARAGEVYEYKSPPTFHTDSVQLYPARWYYQRDWAERWHDWYCVKVIDRTPGGRCVYQYQNTNFPDSVMLYITKGDTLEATGLINYTFSTLNVQGAVKEFIGSFTSAAPQVNVLTPTNNTLSINAGIIPRVLFFKVIPQTRQYIIKTKKGLSHFRKSS